MLPRAIWGEGVPKPTGNAPRGGSIEGRLNFVWVILGDLDRFKRARVLGFIRPVVPLAGLLLYRFEQFEQLFEGVSTCGDIICESGESVSPFLRKRKIFITTFLCS